MLAHDTVKEPRAVLPKRISTDYLAESFKIWMNEEIGASPEKLNNKTFTTDQKYDHIRPVAEYEDMGGVLIAYPGSVTQADNQIQLPPSGPRAFGIPNELIIRMQQLETKNPVHIFITCADSDSNYPDNSAVKNQILASLNETAREHNAKEENKDDQLSINPDLFHIVPWNTDSYWTRDFGPWWIYNEKTKVHGIAKHLYTSLGGGSVGVAEGAENLDPREGHGIFRPNDDYAADKFSDFLNKPIRKYNRKHPESDPIKAHNWYNTGLLNVGGNYMVTRDKKIASSYLVAKQNELPVAKENETTDPGIKVIDERMNYVLEQFNRFMGINTYHALADPTGTYIGHIDCWGKFLDDHTILIAKSQNKEINDGLNAIADFLSEKYSTPHKKFKVIRVMCQNIEIPQSIDPVTDVISPEQSTTAAYTNSLLLNNKAYVPFAGKDYEVCDEEAYDAYTSAGFTVHGIIGKEGHPWLGTDALHCRTRAIPREVVDNWLKAREAVKREETQVRLGGWLPARQATMHSWIGNLKQECKAAQKPIKQVIVDFKNLIESESELYMYFSTMFKQSSARDESDAPDTLIRVKDYHEMLELINHALDKAPEFNTTDLVGFPINAILDRVMATPSGFAAFLNDKVNKAFKNIFNYWCSTVLNTEKSLSVLSNDKTNPDYSKSWMCPEAAAAINIHEFKHEPDKEHWGFTSWNDFFIREFKEGKRPVAHKHDHSVIVSACESQPYAIQKDLQIRDEFWIKKQKYSLEYMLKDSEFTNDFVGGTLYQAFLSAKNYHRWHSPISGTIKEVKVYDGTYYSEAYSEGFDPAGPNNSQGYITQVASRAVIIIDADDKDIGQVCFVSVGMAEVSSNIVTVSINQKVKKGEQLGYFQFGGSTHCLIFQKHLEVDFINTCIPDKNAELAAKDRIIKVNSKIATVKKK